MTISTHAKLFKRGAPIGCVLVSLTLISSVINLGWSQAAGALPLIDNLLDHTAGRILPKTTKKVKDTVNRTVGGATQAVDSVTDKTLPAIARSANKVVAPVTGNALPEVVDTVGATTKPVTRLLTPAADNSRESPRLGSLLDPPLSLPLWRNPLSPLAPRPGVPVVPVTSQALPFARTPLAQPVGSPDGIAPLAASIDNFMGFFPPLLSSITQSLSGKKLDSSRLIIATGILSAMLIAFVITMYRMITRGRHGVYAIGEDHLLEWPLYQRLAKLTAVTFGILSLGAVLMYLTLLRF